MKKGLIKKVETKLAVDKICELQSHIDEYRRFLGDIFVMLAKRRTGQWVIEHRVEGDDYMDFIWRECEKLVDENKELRAKVTLFDDKIQQSPK